MSTCLPASQSAVRPGCAKCMAPEFLHNKGTCNHIGFTKLFSDECLSTASWCFFLSTFHLQIAYRKNGKLANWC